MEQSLVRISGHLIPLIDKVIETETDDFGGKRFANRRQFIDEAVEDFLRDNASHLIPISQEEEVPPIE